jgi:hypothetical protein
MARLNTWIFKDTDQAATATEILIRTDGDEIAARALLTTLLADLQTDDPAESAYDSAKYVNNTKLPTDGFTA